jgi:hypothetical protein
MSSRSSNIDAILTDIVTETFCTGVTSHRNFYESQYLYLACDIHALKYKTCGG